MLDSSVMYYYYVSIEIERCLSCKGQIFFIFTEVLKSKNNLLKRWCKSKYNARVGRGLYMIKRVNKNSKTHGWCYYKWCRGLTSLRISYLQQQLYSSNFISRRWYLPQSPVFSRVLVKITALPHKYSGNNQYNWIWTTDLF